VGGRHHHLRNCAQRDRDSAAGDQRGPLSSTGAAPAILDEPRLVRWGERIGHEVRPPVVLALRGHLGAGKSVLARAVARGAGVEGFIPSPTFNLLFRYRGTAATVVHMDLYRIHDVEELKELAWDELACDGEIVLIEWPERAGGLLPDDRWDIELAAAEEGPDLRRVTVRMVGRPSPLPGFPTAVSAGAR
jgi:tRNA threonylcarbamoyl adenosine modification protein YjeE